MKKLNFNNKTIGLLFLGLVISAALVIILMLFLPFLRINSTINEFYKNSNSETLVSNEAVVRSDNFKPEIKRLKFNFREPKYAAFYKGEDYKNYSQVIITDFFYLKRSGIFGWEVVRYETSYVPFFEGQDVSLDDAYKGVKDSVVGGDISKGLTPNEDKELNDELNIQNIKEGELIDYYQNADQSITYEVRAGKKSGSNYLVNGKDGSNLGIENIVSGEFSTGSNYFVYSMGEYFEPLGEIMPDAQIWVMDIKSSEKKKVFEVGEYPNELMFYATDKKIIYGSKNKIGRLNIDGSGHEVLVSFETPEIPGEEFKLPEIVLVENGKLIMSYPNKDFLTVGIVDSIEISLE